MPTKHTTIEVFGIEKVIRKLDNMNNAITSRLLMGNIGTFIKFLIDKRTHEGKDVQGKKFKPYAESYKSYREKNQRPVDKVDFDFHGSMWDALTFEYGSKSVRVFFQNTPDQYSSTHVTNAAKAFFLNEQRQFFALSDKDVKKIKEMVQKFIKNASKS